MTPSEALGVMGDRLDEQFRDPSVECVTVALSHGAVVGVATRNAHGGWTLDPGPARQICASCRQGGRVGTPFYSIARVNGGRCGMCPCGWAESSLGAS